MNKRRQTIDGLTARDGTKKRRVEVVRGERVWGGEPRPTKRVVESGDRMWRSEPKQTLGLDTVRRVRTSNELGVTGIEVTGTSRRQKVNVKEVPIEEAPRRRRMVASGGQVGAGDAKIEAFLEEIKDEDPTNLVAEKDDGDKKSKKDGRKKRRIIRWSVIGVVAIILGLGIWKGAEIWGILNGALANMTGGNVGAGDIIAADPTVPWKEDENGRTNILVIGTSGHDMDGSEHDGQQLADSIMVISVDQEEGDIKTMSIPRDLVSEDRCTKTAKFNEIYYCEYGQHTKDERYAEVKDDPGELAKLRWEYEERAGERFSRAAGEVVGLEIHYWVHMNWEALIQIVDAIGGVEVAIEYQGDKDKYTGDLPVIWTTDTRGIQDRNWDWACKNTCYYVKYQNGTTAHLDGVHAIALARARGEAQPAYGTNGNWSRERNQQAILDAIIQKVKQTNFVTDLDAALNVVTAVGDNLRMSFNAEGIRRGIHLAGELDMSNVKSIDLAALFTTGMLPVPGVNNHECGGSSPGCLSYVLPKAGTYKYSEIASFVAKNLVVNPIEEEGAIIDVLNGTEQTGLAAKVSKAMEDVGYRIGAIGNTPEGSAYENTVIYRVGDTNKPGTEKKLLERFGVDRMTVGDLPAGIESTANFVVILGNDAT